MGYENLKAWGINVATLSLFLMIPMIVISILFMSVVSCMDMCSFCSCSCCCDYLLPMTERTANMFGLQEESTTEIALVKTRGISKLEVKTNPPESPIKETTPLQTKSDAITVEIQEEATETTYPSLKCPPSFHFYKTSALNKNMLTV